MAPWLICSRSSRSSHFRSGRPLPSDGCAPCLSDEVDPSPTLVAPRYRSMSASQESMTTMHGTCASDRPHASWIGSGSHSPRRTSSLPGSSTSSRNRETIRAVSSRVLERSDVSSRWIPPPFEIRGNSLFSSPADNRLETRKRGPRKCSSNAMDRVVFPVPGSPRSSIVCGAERERNDWSSVGRSRIAATILRRPQRRAIGQARGAHVNWASHLKTAGIGG